MKNGSKYLVVAILATAVAASVGFMALDDEERVSLSQVPAAARATIQKYATGAKIMEIEKSVKDGKTIYEVEIKLGGAERDFMVASDGTFLGWEQEGKEDEEKRISIGQAPPAVQAAILKIVGGNPIKEIVMEMDDGVAEYEAEYTVNGVEHSVTCAATGHVMELEHGVPATSLPPAVLSALARRFPGAKIKEAAAVQVFFHEVELEKDGKKVEVSVMASGEIEDAENEDEEKDDE